MIYLSSLFLFIEQAGFQRVGLAGRRGELTQQLFLRARQVLRHRYADRDELVAAPAAAQVRNTLAAHTEHRVRLRPLGDGKLDLAVQRRHLYLSAERRLRVAYLLLQQNGAAVALESRVRADNYGDEQVALRAAVRTGIALSAQGYGLSVVDTGGDAYAYLKLLTDIAHAAAGGAGLMDYLARASALRARRGRLRHTEGGALRRADAAGALAVGADLRRRPRRAAVALAVRALLDAADEALERLVRATRKLPLTLIAGAPLRHGSTLYNCAVVFTQGKVLGVVPKTYIPDYTEFYENRWFASGAGISEETIPVAGQAADFGAGLTFEVNFGMRLDCGLFLDHRNARSLVREMMKRTQGSKRFLNLFAYTGVATLHAAAGGAKGTTTVDLSQTYLDWAARNLAANGFAFEVADKPNRRDRTDGGSARGRRGGAANKLVRADVTRWIAEARRRHERYDLIFVDPPTFSNSKAMGRRTWDVQRDHAELLIGVSRLLTRGGAAVFSCNLRGFKLDRETIERAGVQVVDITDKTIPADFERNAKVHHCFVLRRI